MCPACVFTIGGGLLIAKKLGINDILTIGVLTIILSVIIDFILRKINHGKVFFNYQKIIISILILLALIITTLIIK